MAPETLKRSSSIVPISALSSIVPRASCCIRRPISLPTEKNSGMNTTATRLTCQDR